MNRREILATVACLAVPPVAFAVPQDPKLFERQVKSGVRFLHEWKHLQQRSDGLWQKQWLFVDSTKYDVVKTGSALRPLVATLQARIVAMSGIKHSDRAAAEMDRTIEEDARLPGGVNAYTLEYDLKFEPTKSGWSFLEGKAQTSLQLMLGGRQEWVELSASEVSEGRGMHGLIVRAFATPVEPQKKTPPASSRVKPRTDA